MRAVLRRNVDFVAEFADKADAQQPRRCTGHLACARGQIRERRFGQVELRQLPQ